MSLLDELWDIGYSLIPKDIHTSLNIKGVWNIQLYFQPQIYERIFACNLLIAQTYFQGCSFYSGERLQSKFLYSLIGKHYSIAKSMPIPVKISVLDSIFAFQRRYRKPTYSEKLEGTPSQKSLWRAKIVSKEVKNLAPINNPSCQPLVSILGVSGAIISELLRENYKVLACDLDTTIIGKKICEGVTVLDGSGQEYCIKNSDVVVVTGMALATETMEKILESSRSLNKKVIIYAQTGANIAPSYLLYGANSVVCEYIPFYDFEGMSEISIYRR